MNRKELLSSLNTVAKGVPRSNMSSCFIFGEKSICSYNDEIAIYHPFKAGVKCSVLADKLLEVVSKLRNKEVELTVESNQLLVKTNTTRTAVPILEESHQLPFEKYAEKKPDMSPFDIDLDTLKTVSSVARKDFIDPILRYVSVEEGSMVASDGFKAIKADVGLKEKFFIPAASIAKIVELSPQLIFIDSGWLFFRQEESKVTYACRTIDSKEEYPDTTFMFSNTEGVELLFPKEVAEAVDRAKVFVKEDGEDAVLELKKKKGKLMITGAGGDGTHKEKIDMEGDEDFCFQASPDVLKDVVRMGGKAVLSDKFIFFSTDSFRYSASLEVE